MKIYTDNIQFAEKHLNVVPEWQKNNLPDIQGEIKKISNRIFEEKNIYYGEIDGNNFWQHSFFVESASQSQYDILIEMVRNNYKIPHGILCLAGSGKKFHGFKNRTWVSMPGNIHLSVFFSPGKQIKNFSSGFMILAAVSVLQTLDTIPTLENRSMIKWVNDILIDDAKVCGVLAHTLTQGKIVSGVVLGIGLNVQVSPVIEPDPFVPKVSSLKDMVQKKIIIDNKIIYSQLINKLQKNYALLISGNYNKLLEIYKTRSLIIGKDVKILTDNLKTKSELIVSGRVVSIGENLELFFENQTTPVTKGRLLLKDRL